MGQCGITSSKTVLVFLNLIFWVSNGRCLNNVQHPSEAEDGLLANCARDALQFGDKTDALCGGNLCVKTHSDVSIHCKLHGR